MDALSQYLVTAQSFTGFARDVDRPKELYAKDPAKFERMWQELFTDQKSYDVWQFKQLLESKGLYLQYEHYAPRLAQDYVPLKMDLRIYPFSKEVGRVACLKVVEMERAAGYRS